MQLYNLRFVLSTYRLKETSRLASIDDRTGGFKLVGAVDSVQQDVQAACSVPETAPSG